MSGSQPVLEARGLCVGYNAIPVVRDLDLEVHAGEVVALLGANGAGKTTSMLALSGELAPTAGVVRIKGEPTSAPLHRRAQRGMRFVTEERSVFMTMSVADNLKLGRAPIARYLELFPELGRLLTTRVGLLSGGEQQMLTLARAIGDEPELLLADELSLGLAPLIVQRLLAAVRAAADAGMAVLIVEQQVRHALRVADRGYVMRRGQVVISGQADDLLRRIDDIEASYLSAGDDVDHPASEALK